MIVKRSIEKKIRAALDVDHLEVVNESHNHNVPPGSESHFKVTIVSSDFNQVGKVARHQRVYGLLADELAGAVHALALHTYTDEEWQKANSSPTSPECLGGSRVT